ncbi:MAG: NCS1 family nucleobase:cation symporter-1 [Gemmatimonadales bacterium]
MSDSRLHNEDLAPIPADQRTWKLWHFVSLWVGMSVCIPTYMLSASMIESGMSWRQSLLAIFLGNAIVLVPLMINGFAGTRYGIPFPVYARASFGLTGAHIPSLLRSVVACGWFGIQTWIGGLAISGLLGIVWSGWAGLGGDWTFMGHGVPEFAGFLLFWLINVYFVWAGTESIKWLETLAAPFLIAMGLALFLWATGAAGGLGAIHAQSDQLVTARQDLGQVGFATTLFIPWLTAMVGFWATLSLNIPDFTRYAVSQRDQAAGQAIGLLVTMPLFSFIGVAVTAATVILFGEAIWNPVELVARLSADQGSVTMGVVAMLAIVVATLSTNIAANVVSPANSFSNLDPRRIGFRAGGLIAAVVGIFIVPWKLLDLYQGWLISYSGLLGAVGGVILCDLVFVRRFHLDVDALYTEGSEYAYDSGFNRAALVATVAGIGVALLGLAVPALRILFDGAWFSGTIVAASVYFLLMRRTAPA